ncbi:hypothetical protein ABFS82_04G112200 [Erythranthe guttata]|uniref:Uncharacterized protein n=1 Tax=Erythranthe guttata TaxID=4155 RepID=A0A022QSP1_ERYGU|nr:hypothetical protein MIMGU_mgv1a014810mg [Erythranthe guttata]
MTLALRHLSLLRSRLQLVTNLFSGRKPNDILLSLDDNQSIQEVFLGARISWVNQIERDHRNQVVSRNFVMRIKKRDKRRVLKPYLQHIHTVSDDIEQRGIYNNRKQRQVEIGSFQSPGEFRLARNRPRRESQNTQRFGNVSEIEAGFRGFRLLCVGQIEVEDYVIRSDGFHGWAVEF